MPEQPQSGPAAKPAPPQKGPASKKAPRKWFRKVPKEILLTPGGMILVFFALIIEVIDWIPLPGIDLAWELPLEIIFILFYIVITGAPWQSTIIPFIIERVPVINDVLPVWFIRMFL